jgi:hypothetical protein
VSTSEGWRHRIVEAAAALLEEASRRDPRLHDARPVDLVAVGVSTVDWERAARAVGGGEWISLPRDALLGATAHLAPGLGRPTVMLLEPDTEGPLTASLARFGEGPAAIYVRAPAISRHPSRAGRVAIAGPFGPSRLLPGPPWGPHVVALEPPATIEP